MTRGRDAGLKASAKRERGPKTQDVQGSDWYEFAFVDKSFDSNTREAKGMCRFCPQRTKPAAVLEFWERNKTVLPHLYAMTRKIFCVPATTAGMERLFSIAGFILSNRRMRFNDRNFHAQVFAHCNLEFSEISPRKRKAESVKNR